MIYVDRATVAEPAEDLAHVKDGLNERQRVAYHRQSGSPDPYKFEAYGRPAVREAMNRLFTLKCAYCESCYATCLPVQVEHYRPKGRVVLTKKPRTYTDGYWWLASTWTNLLPSCIDCNSARTQASAEDGEVEVTGKADYFPLVDEAMRANGEDEEGNEDPILINPCECEPGNYLTFVLRDGESLVAPKVKDEASDGYAKGRGTIDILGLNRTGLVHGRSERIKRAMPWLFVAHDAARRKAELEPGPERDAASATLEMAVAEMKAFVLPSAPWSAAVREALDPGLKDLSLSV